jgi:hypothetical protein
MSIWPKEPLSGHYVTVRVKDSLMGCPAALFLSPILSECLLNTPPGSPTEDTVFANRSLLGALLIRLLS